jgi:hydrogenase maturation protein HypF
VTGQQRTRLGLHVDGIVQGVGFRPYVHELARQLQLDGFVGNDADGVFIEVEGDAWAVRAFADRLPRDAPALADIDTVATRDLPPRGEVGFAIVASPQGGRSRTLVSPDVTTCDACLAEVDDPARRRYRYPFTNCTDCGPRFTIIRALPYDRPATTMDAFPMCGDCRREYEDPGDRRFHAQPVCCPACGPQLSLVVDREVTATGDDALRGAVGRLRDGAIVAVKGLGGYHLAVDARDDVAVTALRARKHREHKPFAVMVADVAAARQLCEVDATAASLLADRARPITLLPRRDDARLADGVAPGSRSLGLMLAYTPLHHLLLAGADGPLVLTSGNRSDEPIAHRDDDARDGLAGIADAFLVHDRDIHARTDDSVARVLAGRATPLRRSRGYAPGPIRLNAAVPRHVLAVGAELKSTVCLARDTRAFPSPHIGDLGDYDTFTAFVATIAHLSELLDVIPQVVAHDLHPDYVSTTHALELAAADGVDLVGVQHHHAHIAACLADNAADGPVIGVAFDGTGYGPDGTVWGGEVLIADLQGFERVAHLAPVPLPGGDAAVRQPWRMAAAYLHAGYGDDLPPDLAVQTRNADRWDAVRSLTVSGTNAPPTSSAGRLFDAVAAVLGVRDTVTYEGQAAVELEQLADPAPQAGYPVAVADGPPWVVDGPGLIRMVTEDLRSGTAPTTVSARFHAAVAGAVVDVCERVRDHTGIDRVALSGGVFQNALLVDQLVRHLDAVGFTVLTHRRVPPNDGGISLGQVAIAAARDRGSLVGDAARG